jgi:hypothetical protein
MSAIDNTRNKVQRILTQLGRVELDKDGDFVLRHESAVMFVEIVKGFGDDGTLVRFTCPLVMNVPLTPAVFKWIAVDGQDFKIGSCGVWMDSEDSKTGSIAFSYTIVGDDVDESEVEAAAMVTLLTSNDLDNQLRDKFGGELFGADD